MVEPLLFIFLSLPIYFWFYQFVLELQNSLSTQWRLLNTIPLIYLFILCCNITTKAPATHVAVVVTQHILQKFEYFSSIIRNYPILIIACIFISNFYSCKYGVKWRPMTGKLFNPLFDLCHSIWIALSTVLNDIVKKKY